MGLGFGLFFLRLTSWLRKQIPKVLIIYLHDYYYTGETNIVLFQRNLNLSLSKCQARSIDVLCLCPYWRSWPAQLRSIHTHMIMKLNATNVTVN